MSVRADSDRVRFAIPKGRMHDNVLSLLGQAGISVASSSRNYRPRISLEAFEVKVLKPRAIVEMLDSGARDLGFAGADWVREHNADVVELLDTELDPVRLVAAAPEELLESGKLPDRPLVVASEYADLARRWITEQGLDAELLVSYGATEVLPPEDADCIIDNTATGSTLAANDLEIIDELMTSSTRLYASREAMACGHRSSRIEEFVLLVRSVLEARRRVMIEVNVTAESMDGVIEVMPCMREPTVSPLRGTGGFAVKAAVQRSDLARVVPLIKSRGGTDVVVTSPTQIVP